jgi:ferredoxin
MGGETSKYVRLEPAVRSKYLGILDYSTSGDCAAGTGSFIDQQASRLRYSVEEAAAAACAEERAARVAGRCSVFAKTSLLTVSIVLGVMIVPTVAAVSEDALRSLPGGIREASYAMGATTWQTIYKVLLPAAKIGIIDAVILGMGRAIGETMAVLMVVGNDGLGACLPACPAGAISIVEREAAFFDEQAVKARMGGCPGSKVMTLKKENPVLQEERPSELQQWPCQIKLVPVEAPYYIGAELLIAADCTAYAYANIHARFMHNKVTLIGCPKLDDGDYTEKLAAIFAQNDIKSVTVLRMEVPCCGGLVLAVKEALVMSRKQIPCQVAVIKIDGTIAQ